MIQNKLNFKTALKSLNNKKNKLVWWFPFNGIIRTDDGEEVGTVSTKIIDKLISSEKLKFTGWGTGLLDHERYYRIKE